MEDLSNQQSTIPTTTPEAQPSPPSSSAAQPQSSSTGREILVILIVLFIIFAIIGFALLSGKINKPKPATTPVKTAPSITPYPTQVMNSLPAFTAPNDWGTYTNNTYFVRFMYPDSLNRITLQKPYYFLTNQIVGFSGKSGTYVAPNYTQESFFGVSVDPDDEGCYVDPQTGARITKAVRTATGTFYVSDSSDAAAGNQYFTKLYRITNDKRCYELALTVHTATDGNGIDFTAVEQSKKQAMMELEQMVTTFRFISPLSPTASIPGQYSSEDLGVTLTYPLTIGSEPTYLVPDDNGIFILANHLPEQLDSDDTPTRITFLREIVSRPLQEYINDLINTDALDSLPRPSFPVTCCAPAGDADAKILQAKLQIKQDKITVDGIEAERIQGLTGYYIVFIKRNSLYKYQLTPYSIKTNSVQQTAWVNALQSIVNNTHFTR